VGRKFVKQAFGTADKVVTIRTWEGGTKGKLAVFARLTGSAGAATLRVYGSFSGFSATDIAGGAAGSTGSNEVQTLDFGGIITGDFWLGSLDISELGNVANPEFVGQHFDDTLNQVTRWATTTVSNSTFQPGNPADTSAGLAGIDDSDFLTQQSTSRTGVLSSGQVVQNNPYSAYVPEQDFTLTFNGHTTSTIIASSDMSADIQAALVGLVDFDPGDVTVARVSATVYTVTFAGQYAEQDTGAITITNVIGFTANGVTETNKGGTAASGGSGLEEITDTASLANGIGQVVGAQENKYPYITLVFGGDGDPGLAAEAYVVAY
jgi:hypothetical protein